MFAGASLNYSLILPQPWTSCCQARNWDLRVLNLGFAFTQKALHFDSRSGYYLNWFCWTIMGMYHLFIFRSCYLIAHFTQRVSSQQMTWGKKSHIQYQQQLANLNSLHPNDRQAVVCWYLWVSAV